MKPSQLRENQSITVENQGIRFQFQFEHGQMWMVVHPPHSENHEEEAEIPILIVEAIDADSMFEDLESHSYSTLPRFEEKSND